MSRREIKVALARAQKLAHDAHASDEKFREACVAFERVCERDAKEARAFHERLADALDQALDALLADDEGANEEAE
jgi:hypothetical protein